MNALLKSVADKEQTKMDLKPHDRTCRTTVGGCGRTVVIVRQPRELDNAPGAWIRNEVTILKAVHEGEVAENMTMINRPTAATFHRLRQQLEQSCIARKERV